MQANAEQAAAKWVARYDAQMTSYGHSGPSLSRQGSGGGRHPLGHPLGPAPPISRQVSNLSMISFASTQSKPYASPRVPLLIALNTAKPSDDRSDED